LLAGRRWSFVVRRRPGFGRSSLVEPPRLKAR
jgi:hypothetical protein